ncbi:GDSL esterase/lipase At5g03610-like [Vicia villosa]|uniref:GDSL esterase/lipase At5g03610-like n=1 Tax=Vicia villosa TaxID=3911 RepID=UPI00273CCD26|nr:GDSL esterase/lipase At5g03610-like [Vicia villosa]
MAKQIAMTLLPLLLLLLFTSITEMVEGTKKTHGVTDSNNSVKLFVFGDSYVDTGNFLDSPAYRPPYGMTYPGTPAGRFSDGRVLSDYIASFLKIETPTPYSLKNSSNLQYGINFAHGGVGIFETLTKGPNMTVQIDSLENLIKQNVYTKQDLESSVALVAVSGNDYTAFIANNKSITEIKSFTETLIKQLTINVERIHNLGVNKVAIGLLEPIGCLPQITVVTFHLSCVAPLNSVAQNHNEVLLQTVKQLNQQVGKSVFVTLDLYNAFLSTIEMMQENQDENLKLLNPLLKPCCNGDGFKNSCGVVDDKGEKKYSLCDEPEASFFWDYVHPSQNGWNSVYQQLQSSLGQLIEKINI